MDTLNPVSRLQELGFIEIGEWVLKESGITYRLSELEDACPALYAFLVDGELRYVGKTVRPLKSRLYGYKNPGKSQKTNSRNNLLINEALVEAKTVLILGYVAKDVQLMNGFSVNLPAALEDSIIEELKPEWNGLRNPKEHNSRLENRNSDYLGQSEKFFQVVIGHTYYTNGFFNIPTRHANLFRKDLAEVKISLDGGLDSIKGKVNWAANSDRTPRIYGGKELRDWLQSRCQIGEFLRVEVLSPTQIELRAG